MPLLYVNLVGQWQPFITSICLSSGWCIGCVKSLYLWSWGVGRPMMWLCCHWHKPYHIWRLLFLKDRLSGGIETYIRNDCVKFYIYYYHQVLLFFIFITVTTICVQNFWCSSTPQICPRGYLILWRLGHFKFSLHAINISDFFKFSCLQCYIIKYILRVFWQGHTHPQSYFVTVTFSTLQAR